MIHIQIENPDQPEVHALLAASDAYLMRLYPPESNHLLDVTALSRPEVTFIVARLNGRALGCGAIVRSGKAWAEIKRMFVTPAARRQQLGRKLLLQLETIATEYGIPLLRLEAGVKQPEALALYRAAGFKEIGAFGDYQPDPLSVFMEKPISAITD